MTRSAALVERDSAILAAVRAGERHAVVARQHGISRAMVGVVVACARWDEKRACEGGELGAWLMRKAAQRPAERGAFVRCCSCCAQRGITTLAALLAHSERELMQRGVWTAANKYVYPLSRQTMNVLQAALAEDGLALRVDDPSPPKPRATRLTARFEAPPDPLPPTDWRAIVAGLRLMAEGLLFEENYRQYDAAFGPRASEAARHALTMAADAVEKACRGAHAAA